MDDERLRAALAGLEAARTLDPSDPRYLELERAAAFLRKTAKKARRASRARHRAAPAEILRCYVCRQMCAPTAHPALCPSCAAHSEAMQGAPLDLRGRTALLTGGRIKIGHATALRLLRAGAAVHVTTRYLEDARRRFAGQPDAADWEDRLHLHQLDLRDLGRFLERVERWREGPPFDILVNNAAQSVWRPPSEVAGLLAGEPEHGLVTALAGQLATLDLRRADSWRQRLGEVAPVDVVEVQLVNAIAPFVLCDRLRPNLARSPFPDRYVVNVTAVEGQFDRPEKSVRHPHTNMAKAALNMLTRTCAADLAGDGIYMVSVDPGWMSHETERGAEIRVPLTPEDSAARLVHPIAAGISGSPVWGVLLKDFAVAPW